MNYKLYNQIKGILNIKSQKLIVLGIGISLAFSSLAGCAKRNNITLASEPISQIADETDNPIAIEDLEAYSIIITLENQNTSVNSNAVQVSNNTITIKDEGTYIVRGNLDDGQIIIDAKKTDKLQLVLDNTQINSSSSAPIYIKQADKVFITLAKDSQNTLSTSGEFVAIGDNNINGVIYSKDDLTLNGEGSLIIVTQYGSGIVSKDDLMITSGNYDIATTDHGLVGKNVGISDGTFDIKASEDGVNSKEDILIAGGKLEISAGDDGIHADFNLTINDGIIHILESEEGLEGETIDITGGNIRVVASDDGINAATSTDSISKDVCYINISGGIIRVNALGDGIDSNGNIYISGGETYVSGPTNNGDAALDYDGVAEISGGVFIASGSGGMAQNFGSNSTQGSMLVTTPTMQTNPIVLKDSTGKELLIFTPENQYNSVVISTPDILKDETYTVIIGEESQTIEMESILYNAGGGMSDRHPGGGMRKSEHPFGDDISGERPEPPIEDKINGVRLKLPQ